MFPGLSRKVERKEKFCYNDAYENQTGGCQDMITIAIVEDEEEEVAMAPMEEETRHPLHAR